MKPAIYRCVIALIRLAVSFIIVWTLLTSLRQLAIKLVASSETETVTGRNNLETMKYRQRCWNAKYSLMPPGQTPIDHTPGNFLPPNSPSCSGGDVFLLFIVHSAVRHRDRRQLIRRTWASVSRIEGDRLVTVFIVGRSDNATSFTALLDEADSRRDIVIADFLDTYRNLTYKHLYALKWVYEMCSSVRYVMKVDDDVVVNVRRMRTELRDKFALKKNFIYCNIHHFARPHRRSHNRWPVTIEEWPDNRYPEYCMGFGYVMPATLVAQLHHCAKWRRYFYIDDVFVTGALAEALGVGRLHWVDGRETVAVESAMTRPKLMINKVLVAFAITNRVSPDLHTRVWREMSRSEE